MEVQTSVIILVCTLLQILLIRRGIKIKKDFQDTAKEFAKKEKTKCKPIKRKSKHKRVRATRARVLSCVLRGTSRTIREISDACGCSYSTAAKHLKTLNEKKKVVLLIDGKVFRYVLPSDGQNVYITKIKR